MKRPTLGDTRTATETEPRCGGGPPPRKEPQRRGGPPARVRRPRRRVRRAARPPADVPARRRRPRVERLHVPLPPRRPSTGGRRGAAVALAPGRRPPERRARLPAAAALAE